MSTTATTKVRAFFDKTTFTLTYVVYDGHSLDAVIIDPVLDYDPAAVRTSTASALEVLTFVRSEGLTVRMLLETHAHADHLSAAQVLKAHFPSAPLAIGARIKEVQQVFARLFGFAENFPVDGSQFDLLLQDQQRVQAGSLCFTVMYTPGHTPACCSYQFGDAVFTGDVLFMPDYGTGRCDFPGGDPALLYRSVTQRLYALPESTRVFTGHDYQPGGRPLRFEATIGEQRRSNIHLHDGTSEASYVEFRRSRDATLKVPALLYPSVQINIAGGHLPEAEQNGTAYLKLPLNLGAAKT